MFGGLLKSAALTATRVPIGQNVAPAVFTEHKRFASEKALRQRMVVVGSIKKITKAMKMVASAKLRRSEDAMTDARNFAKAVVDFWPQEAAPDITVPAKNGSDKPNYLVIAISPDRGLCGSVNGTVSRLARARLFYHNKVAGRNTFAIAIGEKVRGNFERNFPQNLALTVAEHSKLKRRTFKQSCEIAEMVLRSNFDQGELITNRFVNMMSFTSGANHFLSAENALANSAVFEGYEVEGDADALKNFYEYSMACRIHAALAESDMVEYSQRVNSMGSSSKNAEEMLSKIKLLYNRCRQSRITTELVEIISGATAAAEQEQ